MSPTPLPRSSIFPIGLYLEFTATRTWVLQDSLMCHEGHETTTKDGQGLCRE